VILRWALIAYSLVLFAFAVGFFFRLEWAVAIWPWRYDSVDLSYKLVSSFFAAAGTSVLYCAASGDLRAMVGVGIDAIVITLPVAVIGFASGAYLFATASALTAIAGVLAIAWFRRYRFRDTRPTPLPVRISFGLFVLLLTVFGGAMAFGSLRILPWEVVPEVGRVYGFMFLGASSYFLYGLIVPRWSNAIGQLLAFLAYDLVLLLPFFNHFYRVPDDRWINHVVYSAVIAYSAVLAVWYCFLDETMKLQRR
jgi:hypothetical protein